MSPLDIRRDMRVHIRTSIVESDMFAKALAGVVFAISGERHDGARCHVHFDDDSTAWVKVKYLFAGDPPDWMLSPDRDAQSRVEGIQREIEK